MSNEVPSAPSSIDVHHHVIPPVYADALRDARLLEPIAGVDYPDRSPERSLGVMDRHGIAVAMLSVTVPGVHFLEAPPRQPSPAR